MGLKYTSPTISKDKNGCYIVQVRVNGERYKKRISIKQTKQDQKNEAEALVEVWEDMLKNGHNPFNDEDKKKHLKLIHEYILEEKIKEYISVASVSKETLSSYIAKFNLLQPIYDKKIKDITSKDIEGVFNNIKDDYTTSSLKGIKRIWGILFNWMVDNGDIKENPIKIKTKSITSKKDGEDKILAFQPDDFTKVINHLKSLDDKLIFNFASFIYHIHLRPIEIRQLKKSDIDLITNTITIRASTAKTSKKDILKLPKQLIEIIVNDLKYHELQPNDYLFTRLQRNGKKLPLSDSYIGDRFREILKGLKLYESTGYSIYSFKANGNIDKLNLGWTPAQLSKLNRHGSIQTTLIYLKHITKVTEIDNLPHNEL